MAEASCLGQWDLFDPTDNRPGESTPRPVHREESALRLCQGCLVLDQCREWALHAPVAGVAGGMSEQERDDWRRAQTPPVRVTASLRGVLCSRGHLLTLDGVLWQRPSTKSARCRRCAKRDYLLRKSM
jgi:WhiB family redox-sensing transcriptional regulator